MDQTIANTKAREMVDVFCVKIPCLTATCTVVVCSRVEKRASRRGLVGLVATLQVAVAAVSRRRCDRGRGEKQSCRVAGFAFPGSASCKHDSWHLWLKLSFLPVIHANAAETLTISRQRTSSSTRNWGSCDLRAFSRVQSRGFLLLSGSDGRFWFIVHLALGPSCQLRKVARKKIRKFKIKECGKDSHNDEKNVTKFFRSLTLQIQIKFSLHFKCGIFLRFFSFLHLLVPILPHPLENKNFSIPVPAGKTVYTTPIRQDTSRCTKE